jgi:hypothetical protein
MNEQEAKKKAMEAIKDVESRVYESEWRETLCKIQDAIVDAYEKGFEAGLKTEHFR